MRSLIKCNYRFKSYLYMLFATDQADPATSNATQLGLQQPNCTAGAAAGT
jgi:hypothetical protein